MTTLPQQKERSLTKDLIVDVAAAFGAGISVAPFISMIDMVGMDVCVFVHS